MTEKSSTIRPALLRVLLVLVPTLFLLGWSQASLNLSFIHPRTAQETFLLLSISTIVFLAFVIFALILARILLKLYADRRQNILGSRFKTKLVVAFLSLSLVPVCFMFIFAYGLLNRSIDKWFGIPFDLVRRDANEIVSQLEMQSEQRALDASERLALNARLEEALTHSDRATVNSVLDHQVRGLNLLWAVCLDRQGALFAQSGLSIPTREALLHLFPGLAAGELPPQGATGRMVASGTEIFAAAQRVEDEKGGELGTVVLARVLPLNIKAIADQIQTEAQHYDQLSRERKALQRMDLMILLLLTLIILFAATWFAMFLSKQVTVPVQALAEATHEVSRGNLEWQIPVRADGELESLIRLFNDMTHQLRESRKAIEKAKDDLEGANRQLEERGNTMEAIVENVPTGVISFNPKAEITRVNTTAQRMFGGEGASRARFLSDLFPADEAREISRLFRRALRQGVATRQMNLTLGGHLADVAVTLSSVSAQHGAIGFVMVLEDLTELVQAQRSAAWREVAQRIAHEIKNPLTPIQLSTERIHRLIERSSQQPTRATILSTVAESASLIRSEVATLKQLVDEFSNFARFPESHPVSASLNQIIQDALRVFEGRLLTVRIHAELCPQLPVVRADPEQMKRAVVNLIDNAAEALEHSPTKEIWVQTVAELDREAVSLVVADSGPGIRPEDKERLFVPYFSTKRRGTGLGLAIVSRIVSEHHGSIRVEENLPTGTKFIIELPIEVTAAVNTE
jgi:two-component system nitrogen regulation sensor histidine kinase NtrY